MQRSRLIAALVVTYFTYGMVLNTVGTVILQSAATLGVTKAQAGWFDGFKDITIAVVSFLLASYLPRIGLKRAMMAGLAVTGLACVLMPLLPGYLTICLHYAVIGFAFACVKIGLYAMIGLATSTSRQHASLTAIIEGAFMLGVLSIAVLFSHFIGGGRLTSNRDWLDAYWPLAALCVVAFVLLASVVIDESADQPEPGTASIAAMLALVRLPLVLIFIACAFTYVFIEQGIGTWLPTFNNEVLGLSQATSVIAGSVYAASIAAGRLVSGVLMRRVNWYPILIICLVVVAGAVLAIGALSSVSAATTPITDWTKAPLAAYLFLVVGFCLAPVYPTIVSVLLSASPKSRHTELMGLVVMFSALGGTAGSRLTAILFASTSGAIAFSLMAIPAGLLLAGLTLLRRQWVRTRVPE
ncbi:MFS transporter [Glacieibacterium megasporae]|uniref:MFS transporter n=1 Tax=Glacieibacterium megasporae TaxID=2835787 RepID=UPI001C1E64AE|nr:MFS transporter [Polymorphobacter megasporae]UAJ08907.1 MFS transporter [Polymorphobacter megasporae]